MPKFIPPRTHTLSSYRRLKLALGRNTNKPKNIFGYLAELGDTLPAWVGIENDHAFYSSDILIAGSNPILNAILTCKALKSGHSVILHPTDREDSWNYNLLLHGPIRNFVSKQLLNQYDLSKISRSEIAQRLIVETDNHADIELKFGGSSLYKKIPEQDMNKPDAAATQTDRDRLNAWLDTLFGKMFSGLTEEQKSRAITLPPGSRPRYISSDDIEVMFRLEPRNADSASSSSVISIAHKALQKQLGLHFNSGTKDASFKANDLFVSQTIITSQITGLSNCNVEVKDNKEVCFSWDFPNHLTFGSGSWRPADRSGSFDQVVNDITKVTRFQFSKEIVSTSSKTSSYPVTTLI